MEQNPADNHQNAPASPPTSEVDCQSKLQEKERQYLYLYAELQNIKKRMAAEREEIYRSVSKSLTQDLLDVVDSLERSLRFVKPTLDPSLHHGLVLTLRQLLLVLEKYGVKRMDVVGNPFDPNFQESVGTQPSDQEKGTVVEEQLPGYTLNGGLLRPARVVISSGQAQEESKQESA